MAVTNLPDRMTIGEKYNPAMEITEQSEADSYFELLVEHSMRVGRYTRERAEEIERANLGYYAGYFSHETRVRVERLFRCAHPVFGMARGEPMTMEEVFAAGAATAEKAIRG
jgi:hypothetical protein